MFCACATILFANFDKKLDVCKPIFLKPNSNIRIYVKTEYIFSKLLRFC